MTTKTILQLGHWRVLVSEQQLKDPSGRKISLEPKAVEVLQCLARNPGGLVSRTDLISTVWPDVFVSDDSLYRCIYLLRQALSSSTDQGPKIVTVRSRGYRLEIPKRGQIVLEAHRAPVKREPKIWTRLSLVRVAAGAAVLAILGVVLNPSVSDPAKALAAGGQMPLSVVFLDSLQTGALDHDYLEHALTPARRDSVIQGLSIIRPDFSWVSDGEE